MINNSPSNGILGKKKKQKIGQNKERPRLNLTIKTISHRIGTDQGKQNGIENSVEKKKRSPPFGKD